MYKLTQPDGLDFYSKTINYRDAIGTTVRVKDYDLKEVGVCGKGLHASRNPNDCFVGAKIPCAAFRVKGVSKIAGDKEKVRYQGLKIIKEIKDLNNLFGWNYSEAISPVNPFKIKAPKVDQKVFQLLKDWISVRSSIRYSVRYSVRFSIWNSMGVWNSVGSSVWNSVTYSVMSSVGSFVWDSIMDSVYAYTGSLFPNIKKWEHIKHKKGVYPFQPVVDLWKLGFVPSFGGKLWKLYAGPDAKIVWEGKM